MENPGKRSLSISSVSSDVTIDLSGKNESLILVINNYVVSFHTDNSIAFVLYLFM